jgi:hypothetical protein
VLYIPTQKWQAQKITPSPLRGSVTLRSRAIALGGLNTASTKFFLRLKFKSLIDKAHPSAHIIFSL